MRNFNKYYDSLLDCVKKYRRLKRLLNSNQIVNDAERKDLLKLIYKQVEEAKEVANMLEVNM